MDLRETTTQNNIMCIILVSYVQGKEYSKEEKYMVVEKKEEEGGGGTVMGVARL